MGKIIGVWWHLSITSASWEMPSYTDTQSQKPILLIIISCEVRLWKLQTAYSHCCFHNWLWYVCSLDIGVDCSHIRSHEEMEIVEFPTTTTKLRSGNRVFCVCIWERTHKEWNNLFILRKSMMLLFLLLSPHLEFVRVKLACFKNLLLLVLRLLVSLW